MLGDWKALTVAGYGHRLRTAIAVASALSAPLLLGGCAQSQPSADQLRKIAHAIPLPPGLTFVNDVDHLQRPGDFGTQNQHQLRLNYKTATPVDCGQLTDAWRTALKQAHRKIEADEGSQGTLYLKKGDLLIGLNTGSPGIQCSAASIALGVQN